LNREASSRHAENMAQNAVAESTALLSMANCRPGDPLKHGLDASYDLQAMLATAAPMAIFDVRSSSWLEPILLTNSSRVLVLRG